ncbi:aldo/keto reductase [Streptomyces sp. NPDC001068]|uniref:aldo/keto reductase n=1 Tax=Streptomyces sp. NPDC001068 TaxID=3364544 RepID=UPI00367A4A2B
MNATLALGTYRIPAETLTAAVRRAAGAPSGWIDTAPNYCGGRAHRLLAPVLADHPGLPVATKVGYLTAPVARAAHAAGVLPSAGLRHSLAPAYVRWQTDRSRTELGRPRLDGMFLHNPEHHHGDDQAVTGILREAFAVLEETAQAGGIAGYGVATWSGFSDGLFTVPMLDRLAAEAAGSSEHHLRLLQLPVSLVMATHLDEALDETGPIAAAAERGWEVHASAPLHGGELLSLATREIADLVRPDVSVAAACLAAAVSCPGVTKVLLATGEAAHWEEALAVTGGPAIPPATLRTVLDVLAAPV